MIEDLFGNHYAYASKQKKDFQAEYAEYINSKAWKLIRDEKIKQAGGRCERCGISKWSATLEVHHKTYDRFKHERMEDLEVLCPACHSGADQQRKEEKEAHREKSPLYIGFENWMDLGNDRYWRRKSDSFLEGCLKRFLADLGRKTKREYKAKFVRLDDWR